MRVGVIDVGSNTTRLLVAGARSDGLDTLETQKVRLALGAEIERHGAVSAVHVAAAAKAVRGMANAARRKRVASLDVFLTAPGRQATNAAELVAALSRAAGVPARVLTKEEEGTLAYRGAILTADLALPSRIAVCDIGGASTEIAVGDPGGDPDWVESVDLGSVRLPDLAHDLSTLEHDGCALLQAMTEHVLDDVAVGAAEDALLVQQLERAAAGSLRKAAVLLHVKAKCGGERLDRLDAANGRAGEDP